jgi:hypothetical protein
VEAIVQAAAKAHVKVLAPRHADRVAVMTAKAVARMTAKAVALHHARPIASLIAVIVVKPDAKEIVPEVAKILVPGDAKPGARRIVLMIAHPVARALATAFHGMGLIIKNIKNKNDLIFSKIKNCKRNSYHIAKKMTSFSTIKPSYPNGRDPV